MALTIQTMTMSSASPVVLEYLKASTTVVSHRLGGSS